MSGAVCFWHSGPVRALFSSQGFQNVLKARAGSTPQASESCASHTGLLRVERPCRHEARILPLGESLDGHAARGSRSAHDEYAVSGSLHEGAFRLLVNRAVAGPRMHDCTGACSHGRTNHHAVVVDVRIHDVDAARAPSAATRASSASSVKGVATPWGFSDLAIHSMCVPAIMPSMPRSGPLKVATLVGWVFVASRAETITSLSAMSTPRPAAFGSDAMRTALRRLRGPSAERAVAGRIAP